MQTLEQRGLVSAEEVFAKLRRTAPEPGMVLPDYAEYSICNIAPLIHQNFGLANRCPDCLQPLLDRKYKRILLLILDALGWNQVHHFLPHLPPLQRIYERAQVLPLTVPFPSTTTVALTGIYTGLTPVEHGISGHMVYLRELGAVVDILKFSPVGEPRRDVYAERGVDVRQLFPVTTVFQPLREAGLEAMSITRAQFTNTALGRLHHVGAEVRGYLCGADLFVLMRKALQKRTGPGLISVYWDEVDMLSHEYGPFSQMVRASIDRFFYSLEREILDRLTDEEREDTLLLMVADHGQTTCHPEEAVYLGEQRRLWDLCMLPPAGQSRSAYLYANQGEFMALGEELGHFEDRLMIRSSEEALRAGLFGPPEHRHRIRRRVGDYLALGRKGSQVLGVEVLRDQEAPRGRHGSLSEDEMLVPLLALPLDGW